MTTPGTGTASLTLTQCEAQIIESDIKKAEALRYIRDHKIYPKGGFELYCLSKWDLSKRHVNRLIKMHELSIEQQAHLGPIGPTFTERHYREIARLADKALRPNAIKTIRKRFSDSPSVTAAQVKEIVDEMAAKVLPRKVKTGPTGLVEEEFDEDPTGPTDTEPAKLTLSEFDAALSTNIKLLFDEYGAQFDRAVLIDHIEQFISNLAAK